MEVITLATARGGSTQSRNIRDEYESRTGNLGRCDVDLQIASVDALPTHALKAVKQKKKKAFSIASNFFRNSHSGFVQTPGLDDILRVINLIEWHKSDFLKAHSRGNSTRFLLGTVEL